MKKIMRALLCTVFASVLIFSVSVTASAKSQRVFDNAEILTDKEVRTLEKEISDLKEKHEDYDFVILTVNEYVSGDPVDYAEDFYLRSGHRFKDKGFMMLVNMRSRQVTVSAIGDAQNRMNKKTNQAARDDIVEELKNEDYYEAGHVFLSHAENAVIKGKYSLSGIEIVVVLGAAIIVFAVFVFVVKHKYGKEGEAQPYPLKERSTVKITRREDNFVREYTTRTKIESSSGGSGGGGGSYHSSSSGGSSGGTSSF